MVFLITRSQLITMRLAAAKLTRFEKSESRMISFCPVSFNTGPGKDSSVSYLTPAHQIYNFREGELSFAL